MRFVFVLIAAASLVFLYGLDNPAGAAGKDKSGQAEFNEHCAVCHPDGGNIVNPEKTLRKADREKYNVKTAADIMGKMRNPGPGMTKFDKKTIPDAEAKKIAEYILKTFK